MELWESRESSACRWTCDGLCSPYIAKSCLLFEEIDVEVTVILWFWLFVEKRVCLQKMLPRVEVVTRCRSGITHRNRHSQFWGWRKVVPVCSVLNVFNPYSTGIPRSKMQEIHKLDSFPHCVHAAAIEEQPVRRLHRTKLFCQKRVFDGFSQLLLPRKVVRLNRISHPDWVKLCVKLNYAPNQNTKIPSATFSSLSSCCHFTHPTH